MGDPGEPLLLEADQNDIQEIWEKSCKLSPAVEGCVHSLFMEQARTRPSAPAICAWDGEMTYGELDQCSTRLGGYLVSLGVQSEELVPLCSEKSKWTVVAMLAVLKAGGAFVPLEPNHPISRHQEIFEQTRAKVILSSVQYAALWPDSTRQVLAIGNDLMGRLPCETAEKLPKSDPGHVMYVMFTSGSTGVPKGVVLEHRAIATSCLAHGEAMKLGRGTRALQFAAYTFDICIAEIFTTLLFGGCVCTPSEDARRNALSETIQAGDVNWAQLTPTVVRILDPQTMPSLRVLVLGGERVDTAD